MLVVEGGGMVLGLEHLYPRSVKAGGSEAYLGAAEILVISKPFTAGEDAVMAWVTAQDDAQLRGVVPLKDGRDLLLLQRMHTSQSYDAAVGEHLGYVDAAVRCSQLHWED